MEEAVAQVSQELVQLSSGGIDQLGPGPAQDGPFEPERQAGGHRGRQGAGEADEPGDGQDELLLSAWHGGRDGGRETGGQAAGAGGGGPEEGIIHPEHPHSLHLRAPSTADNYPPDWTPLQDA